MTKAARVVRAKEYRVDAILRKFDPADEQV